MKKVRLIILAILCVMLMTLIGCTKIKDNNNIEDLGHNYDDSNIGMEHNHENEEIHVSFNAYGQLMAMLNIDVAEGEDYETMSQDIAVRKGNKIYAGLETEKIINIEPVLEGDTFEGWMEYTVTYEEDNDGFINHIYEKISGETLYTYEEVVNMVPTKDVTYVAKWASVPMDKYFAKEDYMFDTEETTAAIALSSNEGLMKFKSGEEEYETNIYTCWLEEGQNINEATESNEWSTFVSIEKEGAKFTGWTVYKADSFSWDSAESKEEGVTSYPFNNNAEDFNYILLTNSTVYSNSLSTEELFKIKNNGSFYYAVANWE